MNTNNQTMNNQSMNNQSMNNQTMNNQSMNNQVSNFTIHFEPSMLNKNNRINFEFIISNNETISIKRKCSEDDIQECERKRQKYEDEFININRDTGTIDEIIDIYSNLPSEPDPNSPTRKRNIGKTIRALKDAERNFMSKKIVRSKIIQAYTIINKHKDIREYDYALSKLHSFLPGVSTLRSIIIKHKKRLLAKTNINM